MSTGNSIHAPQNESAQPKGQICVASIPADFRTQWSTEVDGYFDRLYASHSEAMGKDPTEIVRGLQTYLKDKVRSSRANPDWVKAIVLSHPEFKALEASAKRIRENQAKFRVPGLIDRIRNQGQEAQGGIEGPTKRVRTLSYTLAGARRVVYSTKKYVWNRLSQQPTSVNKWSEQIAAAFARGDVEALKRLWALETIDMSASSLPLFWSWFREESIQIMGDPATQEHLEQLVASYSVSKLTRVVQILQLRNGDVVEFRRLSDSHDKKILHFRIVKIESTQDSKDEYVINCLVNCFYEQAKTGYLVKERIMQIRMSKRTGLQEGGSLRVFANGSEFINSNIWAMWVHTSDKSAFGWFLKSPRFIG